ncbi:unnamed protein product [Ambrosiozyma monospora]|uniref:Unnamed protein product n=1 Tax=Ambrosiozyma monospora TaxID=43982 RepID=A0A9W6T436_AMBMO|nr:unnamed protein product [Ambrosiozyma monospora]
MNKFTKSMDSKQSLINWICSIAVTFGKTFKLEILLSLILFCRFQTLKNYNRRHDNIFRFNKTYHLYHHFFGSLVQTILIYIISQSLFCRFIGVGYIAKSILWIFHKLEILAIKLIIKIPYDPLSEVINDMNTLIDVTLPLEITDLEMKLYYDYPKWFQMYKMVMELLSIFNGGLLLLFCFLVAMNSLCCNHGYKSKGNKNIEPRARSLYLWARQMEYTFSYVESVPNFIGFLIKPQNSYSMIHSFFCHHFILCIPWCFSILSQYIPLFVFLLIIETAIPVFSLQLVIQSDFSWNNICERLFSFGYNISSNEEANSSFFSRSIKYAIQLKLFKTKHPSLFYFGIPFTFLIIMYIMMRITHRLLLSTFKMIKFIVLPPKNPTGLDMYEVGKIESVDLFVWHLLLKVYYCSFDRVVINENYEDVNDDNDTVGSLVERLIEVCDVPLGEQCRTRKLLQKELLLLIEDSPITEELDFGNFIMKCCNDTQELKKYPLKEIEDFLLVGLKVSAGPLSKIPNQLLLQYELSQSEDIDEFGMKILKRRHKMHAFFK